jgi:hypothetical protein
MKIFYSIFTFLATKFVRVYLQTWFKLLAFNLTWVPQPAGTLLGKKLSMNDSAFIFCTIFEGFFNKHVFLNQKIKLQHCAAQAKRIDHLHPKDAKNNCEQIERELARQEETIKSMFSDVQILRDNRFSQAQELHRR